MNLFDGDSPPTLFFLLYWYNALSVIALEHVSLREIKAVCLINSEADGSEHEMTDLVNYQSAKATNGSATIRHEKNADFCN